MNVNKRPPLQKNELCSTDPLCSLSFSLNHSRNAGSLTTLKLRVFSRLLKTHLLLTSNAAKIFRSLKSLVGFLLQNVVPNLSHWHAVASLTSPQLISFPPFYNPSPTTFSTVHCSDVIRIATIIIASKLQVALFHTFFVIVTVRVVLEEVIVLGIKQSSLTLFGIFWLCLSANCFLALKSASLNPAAPFLT